ncbi:MAG: CTP synthase [Gammaproteobacteria bacterium]|nr:CTP synthase [Gammaproteobacteria bacterium]MBL6819031.1 CTP synthase [Gammaproteobacteria bacterium]MBL6899133.1 CTP synthase [Gammaproteobacteria bacterium]
MARYIFITGGVVSSLGKGIAAASLASLFKLRGYKVSLQKLDPYINLDPGTMSPFQHGEVYVTDDGAETDLDLGHYERFVGIRMSQNSNVTAGRVYSNVIKKEREGKYLGSTVQVIPHVTDEIKHLIKKGSSNVDISFIEVGGTVGDIESLPFLEAIRQLNMEMNDSHTLFIHLTLLPKVEVTNEIKTKPTQHSVKELRSIGIQPDVLLCRAKDTIDENTKNKISLFTNVNKDAVFSAQDAKSIYEIPIFYKNQKVDEYILKKLKVPYKKSVIRPWVTFTNKLNKCKRKVKIGMVGKYVDLADSYKSLNESLLHASVQNNNAIEIDFIDSEDIAKRNIKKLNKLHGIVVPGGFGNRGVEGKILTANYARINNIPYLGICLGMQISVIEFARNILGLKNANSTEFDLKTPHPVVSLVSEWEDNIKGTIKGNIDELGGTMRLGAQKCTLINNSLVHSLYKKNIITERHRHRYEVNNKYVNQFNNTDLIFSGYSGKKELMEVLEIKNHPWYLACQFHPEFTSSPIKGHPLFNSFIKSSYETK